MNDVRMDKTVLISIIKLNKDKHVKEYNEAVIGYRESVAKELQTKLDICKSGGNFSMGSSLDKPQCFENEYNVVLRKLELSLDVTIELNDTQFKNFVLDEWSWTSSFKSTSAIYNNMA
jgi:hypothetical protein